MPRLARPVGGICLEPPSPEEALVRRAAARSAGGGSGATVSTSSDSHGAFFERTMRRKSDDRYGVTGSRGSPTYSSVARTSCRRGAGVATTGATRAGESGTGCGAPSAASSRFASSRRSSLASSRKYSRRSSPRSSGSPWPGGWRTRRACQRTGPSPGTGFPCGDALPIPAILAVLRSSMPRPRRSPMASARWSRGRVLAYCGSESSASCSRGGRRLTVVTGGGSRLQSPRPPRRAGSRTAVRAAVSARARRPPRNGQRMAPLINQPRIAIAR